MTSTRDVSLDSLANTPDENVTLKSACFDLVKEGILVHDGSGNLLLMNEPGVRQLSTERDEIDLSETSSIEALYESYRRCTLAGDPVPHSQDPVALLKNGETYSNLDVKLVHRETGESWIGRFSNQQILPSSEENQLFVTTVEDITVQKQTEEKIRRSNRRLKLLSDSTAELLLEEDPLDFLDNLYQRLSGELDVEAYFHYRISPEAEKLELVASGGISEPTTEELQRLELGGSVCGTVAQTCSQMIVEHVQDSTEELTRTIRRLGLTAYICHPLIARGRLLGTLSFGSRSTDTFDDETVGLVRTVCAQVAAVIERQQTRDALHRSREELRSVNQTLEEKVHERTKQVRQLSQTVTVAEQQERRRIGQDLHDGVSSQLSGLALMLGSLERKAQDEYPELLDSLRQIKSIVKDTNQDVQRIARGLHPIRLERAGLPGALEQLISDSFPSAEVDCRFECGEDLPELPKEVASHLYWIAQEAVTNARKYADADEIVVRLERTDEQLCLAVEDDGQGLPDDFESADGLGLNTMHNRAKLIGGQLDIQSFPGEGTAIECRVPLAACG